MIPPNCIVGGIYLLDQECYRDEKIKTIIRKGEAEGADGALQDAEG
jgi:hypothetical protein